MVPEIRCAMDGWMDGYMDRWMDGRTNGQIEGSTDGQTEKSDVLRCVPHLKTCQAQRCQLLKSNAGEARIQRASQPITLSPLSGVQGRKP